MNNPDNIKRQTIEDRNKKSPQNAEHALKAAKLLTFTYMTREKIPLGKTTGDEPPSYLEVDSELLNNMGFHIEQIRMPMPTPDMPNDPEWYHQIFHELIHSTGATSRLNRNRPAYNDLDEDTMDDYAFEEMVAEMGAQMLLRFTNLDIFHPDLLTKSTHYIADYWALRGFDQDVLEHVTKLAREAYRYVVKSSGDYIKESNDNK